jgi:hypothetical protein
VRHFFFFLSFINLSVSFALPYGHKSAFLANTTSRPGDSAAAVNFPSALAFDQTTGTKLASGLAFIKPEITSDKDFELSAEAKFVPFFAGTIWGEGHYKFSTYARYSDDIAIQANLRENDLNSRTESSQQNLEVGLGFGYKIFSDISFGLSLELDIQNEQSLVTISGQVTGQDFLSSINSKERIFSSTLKSSVSYQQDHNFFSFAIRTPSLAISEKGHQNYNSLLNGVGLESNDSNYKPTEETPWVLFLGWSVNSDIASVTVETNYIMPVKFTDVTGPDAEDRDRVSYKDAFQFSLGVEHKLNTDSILAGFSYLEKRKEKVSGEYQDFSKLMTLGYEFKNSESNPVVGVFFEQFGETAKIYGLMYATNYKL